jgi:hypothetical protein
MSVVEDEDLCYENYCRRHRYLQKKSKNEILLRIKKNEIHGQL